MGKQRLEPVEKLVQEHSLVTLLQKIDVMDIQEIQPKGSDPDNRFVQVAFSVISVGLLLFTYYSAALFPMPAYVQRAIHMAFIIPLAMIIYPRTKKDKKNLPVIESLVNSLIIILALAALAHLATHWKQLYISEMTLVDQVAGLVIILITLEITRRTMGWALVLIVVMGVLYSLTGPWLPDIIAHRGYSFGRILSQIAVGTEGLFGSTLGISATYVAGFIFFASYLEVLGGLRGFMKLSMSIAGSLTGGPAKMAVIASAFFGMISGSTVANVVSTGSITIPLMKNMGYPKEWAGGVEAVASTGGTFTPPIMGATAFILAEFMGVPYLEVMKAAAIPAFLYYAGFFSAVHSQSCKQGFIGFPKDKLPPLRESFISNIHLLIPIFLLVLLLIRRNVAINAAFYSTIALFVFASLKQSTRPNFERIVKGARSASKSLVVVSSACASAGVVIAVLNLTGLGFKLSSIIVTVSNGKLILGLLLTQLAAVILGMGLVTPATYALLAVLVAPGLVKMGVTPMAAHMFIFFCSALAPITPPVALATYAAAGVAGANPFRVGSNAVKLGLVAFFLPYFFVYNPSLLGYGKALNISIDFLTALIGVITLGIATQGYFRVNLSRFVQLLLFLLSLMLMVPNKLLSGTAIIGLVVIYVFSDKLQREQKGYEQTNSNY